MREETAGGLHTAKNNLDKEQGEVKIQNKQTKYNRKYEGINKIGLTRGGQRSAKTRDKHRDETEGIK